MTTADDDHRYPWIFDVVDAHGRPGRVRIGAENGRVIQDGPRWWSADQDTADRIAASIYAASSRAGQQQKELRRAEQQQRGERS